MNSFEDVTSLQECVCEVMDSRVTAYGVDNASVNLGVNDSVFQKLKSKENNNIRAAHCDDHIFPNFVKNTLKVIPVDVDKIIVSKAFAKFTCSTMKR